MISRWVTSTKGWAWQAARFAFQTLLLIAGVLLLMHTLIAAIDQEAKSRVLGLLTPEQQTEVMNRLKGDGK
jgi:hypothetical protein